MTSAKLPRQPKLHLKLPAFCGASLLSLFFLLSILFLSQLTATAIRVWDNDAGVDRTVLCSKKRLLYHIQTDQISFGQANREPVQDFQLVCPLCAQSSPGFNTPRNDDVGVEISKISTSVIPTSGSLASDIPKPFATFRYFSLSRQLSADSGYHYLFARHARRSRTDLKHCVRRSSREDKDVIHSKFAVGRQALLAGAARSEQNRSDSV